MKVTVETVTHILKCLDFRADEDLSSYHRNRLNESAENVETGMGFPDRHTAIPRVELQTVV